MPRGQPGPGADLHVLPPLSTTMGWGLKKKALEGAHPALPAPGRGLVLIQLPGQSSGRGFCQCCRS